MTFDSFIRKHDGKFVEAGGSENAKNQCTDLANAFIDEVLKLPKILWTNAKDFPSKAGNKYKFIGNTREGLPAKGDLIVWDGNVGGGNGHIGIFVEGDINSFRSFDQNWPVGSKCHIQGHYYKNVSGWLRTKNANMSDYYKGIDLNNKESIKVCVDAWKDVIDGKYIKKEKLSELKETMSGNDKASKKRVANEKKQYTDLLEKLASDEYLSCTQQVPDILEQITLLIQSEDKIPTKLEPKIKDFEKRIEDIARVLGVEEGDIENAIKKIEAGNPVVVNEHSRICKWLVSKGL